MAERRLTDQEILDLRQMAPADATRALVCGHAGPFAGCGLGGSAPALVHLLHLVYRLTRRKKPRGIFATAAAWDAAPAFAARVRSALRSSRSAEEFAVVLLKRCELKIEHLRAEDTAWWFAERRHHDWRAWKGAVEDALGVFATIDQIHAEIRFTDTEENDDAE